MNIYLLKRRKKSGSLKSFDFKWDLKKCGENIAISEDGKSVNLEEKGYVFRTVLGDTPMYKGNYYWEILPSLSTKFPLKIGVSAKIPDFNKAFSDFKEGFAYYGSGSLRNGSAILGESFGNPFVNEGVIGVFLNMDKGILSFSLNNRYLGVAYKSKFLTLGPIFPAVALLNCAGFKTFT